MWLAGGLQCDEVIPSLSRVLEFSVGELWVQNKGLISKFERRGLYFRDVSYYALALYTYFI